MKKQNAQNGKSSLLSSLRGASATRQSKLKWIAALPLVARNDIVRESGNALWFILIAILLLGLLTSMMTRSGSSTNDTGDYEQLTIQANEILNYAKSIENGVQSLLARGCSENEISFEANNNSGYTNPNSPTDNSCHVFEPAGAGLAYIEPNEKWLDTNQSSEDLYQELYFPETICIKSVGSIDSICNTDSIDNEDLILVIPYIKQQVCEQINKAMNTNTIPKDNSSAWNLTEPKFVGNYIEERRLGNGGDDFDNQYSLCFEGGTNPASNTYHFYHVLHAR